MYDFELKKVSKLERKLIVTLPSDEVEKEREARLKKLAPRVKMDGFRPGKVPFKVVEKKYGAHVLYEVLEELMRKSYAEILESEKVQPVAAPKIDLDKYKEGKPINYTASFEVYPEIKLTALEKIKVEKPVVKIGDAEVEEVVDKLRLQQATWQDANRGIKKGDRVVIDAKGSIKGEEMPELVRKDFMFVLGDGLMREDFEEHLYKQKAEADLRFKVKYPKDFGDEKLAGKKVEFEVKIHKVEEAMLPEVNDEFCTKMGITEGGPQKLREEIKQNLDRDVDEAVQKKFKDNLLSALLDQHKVDLPESLLEREIKRLEEQQQKFKEQMQEYAKKAGKEMGDLPGGLSEEKMREAAERNVGLNLLLQEIILMLKITPDADKVRKRIEKLAAAYDNKEEAINWYYSNKQLLNYVESQVLEEQVMADMQTKVGVQEKTYGYKDILKR